MSNESSPHELQTPHTEMESQSGVKNQPEESLEESIQKNIHALIHKLPAEQYVILSFISDQSGIPISVLQKQLKIEMDRAKNPPVKNETQDSPKPLAIVTISPTERFELHNDGVYQIVKHFSKEGEAVESSNHVWQWVKDSFTITGVLENPEKQGKRNYVIVYRNYTRADFSVAEIKSLLFDSHLCESKYKQILGRLIDQYATDVNLPVMEISKECGFTEHGWHLLGTHFIKWDGAIQDQIRLGIEQTMGMIVDVIKVKQLMRDLYDAYSIKHKDIVFAWAMQAPFGYALRELVGLLIYIALVGKKGAGKSWALIPLISRIWNNMAGQDAVLSDTVLKSHARFGDYFTATTFPTLVDEVSADIHPTIKETLKAMATGKEAFQRLEKDRSLKSNRPFTSPAAYTCNIPEDTELFTDPNYPDKGIMIPFESVTTPAQKTKFNAAVQALSPGFIGKYIIEATRDWTAGSLYIQYEKCIKLSKYKHPELWEGLSSRQYTIFGLLELGKWIMHTLFDIELDVSGVAKILKEGATFGNEQWFNLIREYVQISNQYDWEWVYNKEHPTSRPVKPNWVTSQIPYTTDKMNGYHLKTSHITDIAKQLGVKKSPSMNTLINILQAKWPNVKIGRYESNKTVYIPSEYINESE